MANLSCWILFGVISGSVASKVMPGLRAGGPFVAIVIGVAAAMLGGVAGVLTSGSSATAQRLDSRIMLHAMFGALSCLFLYRCFAMRGPEQLSALENETN